jgi:hypothetical protein
VIGGRGCQLYADEAIKLASEIRYKLGTAVRNYDARGAVVLPDLAKEKVSCSDCCDGRVRCDEVCALRDTIDDVHNGIIAIGVR